jgi:hypothetical protein
LGNEVVNHLILHIFIIFPWEMNDHCLHNDIVELFYCSLENIALLLIQRT